MLVLKNKITRLWLSVGLVLAIFSINSCEKSVEPVECEDYPFYISSSSPSRIFVFNPNSLKLDSTSVPWNAAITASADGQLLYVALGSSVLIVDADSFSTVTELFYQHTSPIAVSPDNRYIAILGLDLYIIRTSDNSLIFTDTTQLLYDAGSFSNDGNTFFCVSNINQDSNYVTYQIDLSDSLFPVVRRGFSDGSVHQIIPSIDNSKWFLYLGVGLWTSAFEVYDVALDSIIFRDILIPGTGFHTGSPDGKHVFYTSPGRCGEVPAAPIFKIYNVELNDIESVFTDSANFCGGPACIAPRNLAVSADNKYLGILGGDACLRPEFYVYDINSSKIVFRIGLDTGLRIFGNITSQVQR